MRDRLFDIIEGNSDLFISKLISWIILLAILVSSVAFVLESVHELHEDYSKIFHWIDVTVVIIFSLEYLSRFILVRRKLEFVRQPLNLIDVIAILPFYIELLIPSNIDLRIVRIIRLVRIFRMFKIAKYSESFTLTMRALKESSAALIALVILMMIIMVMCSSVMYFAEHDAHISYCPDAPNCRGDWREGPDSSKKIECSLCHKPVPMPIGTASKADSYRSIVSTFWWCIVTMTTVGYGDVVPQTKIGGIIAGFTMICGILCIALPTGVIATNFSALYLQAIEEKKKKAMEGKTAVDPFKQSVDHLLKAAQEVLKQSSAKNRIHCPHCSKEISLS
ncbi:MAG: ion transporter [Planctomycetota bacterium]